MDYEVDEDTLEAFKLYCKVDLTFEDELLKEMIISNAEQLAYAIEEKYDLDYWMENKSFLLACKKMVKEDYDHRGLTSNFQRYQLPNGVLNIVHQLRSKECDKDGF